MTDTGAVTVKGDATLEGAVDNISLKGTSTITAESIGPLASLLHVIDLGDTYEDGIAFLTGSLTGSQGVLWGVHVLLNTSTAFAASTEVYSNFYSRIAGWHSILSGANFGTNVRLQNVYIDGTDLVFSFLNTARSSSVVNAKIAYAVWKAD